MNLKSLLRLYYPALLILTTVLAFTLYSWLQASANYKIRRARLFEQRAANIADAINDRMMDYSQILRGCQALFDASSAITLDEWSIFVKSLDVENGYPGIQGLAFSRYLPTADSSAFERYAGKSIAEYRITSTFEYSVMAPVLYIYPLDKRNKRAVGFDLYSEVNRRNAIRRAIASGNPSITRKIRLRQETESNVQPGFLMFLPVYSDPKHTRVIGFVANVFRTHDLMQTLLKGFPDMDIRLYDGLNTSPEHLIYQKLKRGGSIKEDLQWNKTLLVAGLPWRLVVQPNAEFGSTAEKQQPLLILCVGLILSIFLFTVSFNMIRRRMRLAIELDKTQLLERKKDEFISTASHELKTPLTSIKASVQILQRSELSEKDRFLLNKAKTNVDKLYNLISDLLDVSKVQAGQFKLNRAAFLLPELISECVESVGHLYSSHQILVSNIVPPVTCYGDKFRLEQAINNLLVNAIKYSPNADKVELTAEIVNQQIQVQIRDFGIGISQTNLNKIFDRFFRAEELSQVVSGLGIGLHISYEIIKMHQGKIEVQSEVNKGTVFTVSLPLNPAIVS